MRNLLQDLRYAVRVLCHNPRFTVIAALTLALGLSASTVIFNYFDAVYFRGLPITRPGDLVYATTGQKGSPHQAVSNLDYLDYRKDNHVFRDLCTYGTRGAFLDIDGENRHVTVQLVSGNYFAVLGINPAAGRLLTPEDDRETSPPAVVISHRLWRQAFGGRPEAVGRTVRVNYANFTIAGVAPPRFRGVDRFQDVALWIPLNQRPAMVQGYRFELDARQKRWLDEMAGRLRDGTSIENARAELATISSRLAESYPRSNSGWTVSVTSEAMRRRKAVAEDGGYLLALAVLVLLIACANVGNLVIAHADSRRREVAVRLAVGASQRQVLRAMLARSAVLSLLGTVAGLLCSMWLLDLLPLLMPPDLRVLSADLRLNARSALYTFLASLIATFLFASAATLRTARTDLVPALKDGADTRTVFGRRLSLRNLLVIAQVAISLVLMGSAGLLLKSYIRSLGIRPGFDNRGQIVQFGVVPGFHGYEGYRLNSFYEEFRRRLQDIPGVAHASYAARTPLSESGWARAAEVAIPGREPLPGREGPQARYTLIGPNYFETLGTRLRAGRAVDERDTPRSAPVAVINQAMARQFWPDQDPIGREFLMGSGKREVRVIGVAEDTPVRGLHESPQPYFFIPEAQELEGEACFLMAVPGDKASALTAARAELGRIDKAMSIAESGTMSETLDRVLYDERLACWMAGSLGVLGLALGAAGLYGVISLAAGRRTREIGIRLALGATRGNALMTVVREGAVLTLLGIGAGTLAGFGATRWIASRLHGVSRFDPGILIAAVLLHFALGVLACYFPARRAAGTDPALVLRTE